MLCKKGNLKFLKNALTSCNCRNFHQSSAFNRGFFEQYRRGTIPPEIHDKPWQEHIKEGRKIFVQECKLWVDEVKEKFRQDRKLYQHGDTDVFFRFDNKECLKKWRVGSDKINNEGFSDCHFTINDKGKGVFYGNIDTTPPKDGKSRFAGYCGIKSTRKTKSFMREDCYFWDWFTHLELRVKGDGRGYAINLGLGLYYDVTWFSTFTYPMYTRGGPYWETIRIPFSKFFMQSKGRIQDRQERIPLNKVNSVGITAATVPGPFHLEIDYIGCHKDDSFKEKCAYEMYKIPKELVTD
ncbi:complex I intermediate-associated protein 30, mitochondrial [Parasteatoda tepidariorum]|uniref:complex I intermediate-associated protein 30, mitochondrial n=1 Tax=Parasteatoda tepidariorum TaxID=114398 RepID=UPI001C724C8F|nr:complex I intermediate-associated protein 30, mitochondrial [Parasteatoda tepidariorum]